MGWKTPIDPVNAAFHARTTAGERKALDVIIGRWAAEQEAAGASASGATSVAWFRQLVRRLAAEQGIPVEVIKEAPPAPKVRKKAAPKRARR